MYIFIFQENMIFLECEEYSLLKPRVNEDDDTNYYRPTFVGGSVAIKNEFPHISAIGWRLNKNITFWKCGGSLISEKFVISAAHCVYTNEGQPNVIRVGDIDLTNVYDGATPQEFEIKNIFIYPKYKRSFKYHDIVLFELDRNAR